MGVPIAPSMMATRSASNWRRAVSAADILGEADDMVKEGLAGKKECNDALLCKKHIFVCECVDMFLGLRLDLVGSGAQGAPSPDVLFLNFAETGKAVKTGHSCAAVSHQT